MGTVSSGSSLGSKGSGKLGSKVISSAAVAALLVVALLWYGIIWFFSDEPDQFNVVNRALENAGAMDASDLVRGYVTTNTLLEVSETLLNKRGGYISNDILPPFIFMDNMPSWEFGVLVQIRDLAKAFRNDFARSQSQSTENPSLSEAEPKFNFDNDSWILPSSEGEYQKGIEYLIKYQKALSTNDPNAQFFARADNLAAWLSIVQKRLGSISQGLSASVGQVRINTDLAGDAEATSSAGAPGLVEDKTSWMEIDNRFYEARGHAWALIHFLRAVEADFSDVLQKKNALVSLRQIIRELEATQQSTWSPMVLNGSGYGLLPNYSLILANYISRANAAIIDLQRLLEEG